MNDDDIANMIFEQEMVNDDSIRLYADIEVNCNTVAIQYDPVQSSKVIDLMNSSRTTSALCMNNEQSVIKMSENVMSFGCYSCKSLPIIRYPSTRIILPQSSKSLFFCSTLFQRQYQADYSFCRKLSRIPVKIQKSNVNVLSIIEKKKSDPTIGELLGDDDKFHSSYHTRYDLPRYEQKSDRHYHRNRHRSRSRSPLNDGTTIRIQQEHQSYHQQRLIPLSSETMTTLPSTDQIFFNPIFYPSYYHYSNLFSFYPFSITDPYTGMPFTLPSQEINYQSQFYHQIDKYNHRKHSNSRHRDKQSTKSYSSRQHQYYHR